MVIKVRTLLWGFLIVVVIIAIFHDQLNWLADFFIDPGSKVPDPSEIDVPVVR